MPDPADPSSPSSPGTVRTTTTYTYGRAWLPLLIAAIVVPLVVAAIAVATRRDHVQDNLSGRAQAALAVAGYPSAQVSFNGRDATIKGVPAASAEAARRAVLHVRGVRVAAIGAVEASPPGSATLTPSSSAPSSSVPATPLRIAESGTQITLIGTVADQATEQAIVRAATASAGGRRVVDRLTVAAGSPSSVTPAVVSKLVAALGAGGDRGLSFDGRTVTLTGTAPDSATKAAIEQRARTAVPSATIDNRLSVPAAPPAKARLQTRVNAQLKAHPVTFQPDSATLSGTGLATVRTVASLLRNTAGLRIEVDGHVAKTPGNSLNPRTLSQQRANAVKAMLVRLGVKGSITAKGFGDSRPIASNSTSAGQAKNRRVEIRLL